MRTIPAGRRIIGSDGTLSPFQAVASRVIASALALNAIQCGVWFEVDAQVSTPPCQAIRVARDHSSPPRRSFSTLLASASYSEASDNRASIRR